MYVPNWLRRSFSNSIPQNHCVLDCILVVVLKKCEPEPSSYQLNSSIRVLRNLVFQGAARSQVWSLYLKTSGKGLWLKTSILLVFFLWLGKSFKVLVINRLADHLKQHGLFSNFRCGFRSYQSIADLLAFVSNRIVRTLTDLELIEL